MLCYVILYYIVLYRIVSYRIVSYRIISYHIISYYIILYYIILYYITLYYIICYNLMGPPSYMRSVVDRNVVMRRMIVNKLRTIAADGDRCTITADSKAVCLIKILSV